MIPYSYRMLFALLYSTVQYEICTVLTKEEVTLPKDLRNSCSAEHLLVLSVPYGTGTVRFVRYSMCEYNHKTRSRVVLYVVLYEVMLACCFGSADRHHENHQKLLILSSLKEVPTTPGYFLLHSCIPTLLNHDATKSVEQELTGMGINACHCHRSLRV